jgi:hypothetical protein
MLSISLLLAASRNACGADDPKALVSRAVQALGGEARLAQAKAVQTKIKGTLHDPGRIAFTVESYSQLPDRSKVVWHMSLQGTTVTLIHVHDGDKGWYRDNGVTMPADSQLIAEMKESAHVNRVVSLLPLLKENAFKLLPLGEVKGQGQSMDGVNVTSTGSPDIALFFDRGTGLLAKVEFKHKEANRQVLRQEYLTDYQEVQSAVADERVLKGAGLATDNNTLLEFLRKHTLTDAKREQIQTSIRKLGDASFEVREQAKQDLIRQGPIAAPLLTRVVKDPDPEVASRAKECLQAFGKPVSETVPAAVVRLLALRQPAGTAEVLLAYLPCVGQETAVQEVRAALAAVAQRDGKPDPVLVQALEDKDPERRAAAAAALGRGSEPGKERPGQQLFLPGLKRARKVVIFQDSKKLLEYEEQEVKFFNKFKDDVFAKP